MLTAFLISVFSGWWAKRRYRKIKDAKKKHAECFAVSPVLGGSLIHVRDAERSDAQWLDTDRTGVCGSGSYCRHSAV